MIAHAIQELSIGDLHPVILHFPIVLFWLGFVFDIMRWFGKTSVYPMAHWFIIAGAVLAIPTAITGLEASEMHEGSPYVMIHRNFALATMSFAFLHAAYRIYVLATSKVSVTLCVILSAINVLLVSVTADYGGAVTRGKPLIMLPLPESPSAENTETQ